MSEVSREEKACAGIGLSVGAAGLATINGATTAAGGGMLAAGITNCVAAAPGIAKLTVVAGQAIAAIPAVVPIVVVGGIAYAGYNLIRYEIEHH